MTFYIVVGKYSGCFWEKKPGHFRIVLGWVSIALLDFDLEVYTSRVSKHIRKLEKQVRLNEQYQIILNNKEGKVNVEGERV